MNTNTIYLFYGGGSEYTLSPLADYIRKKGNEVLEIDFEKLEVKEILDILKSIKSKHIVFLTSGHLFFDSKNYSMLLKEKEVMSPLEIMDYLKPIKSIFYPHDIECFLHPSEIKWIDLFDIIMLPFKNNQYYEIKNINSNTYDMGWIKKKKYCFKSIKNKIHKNIHNIAYFPSNFFYNINKYGYEGFAKLIYENFPNDKNIKIKLFDGKEADFLKNIINKYDIEVLDNNITVFDSCSESVIIGNGISSIIFEAAYSGIPVISIMDGAETDEYYSKKLLNFNNVYSAKYNEISDLLKNREMVIGEEILKPFNFELAYELISKGDII